MLHATRIIEGCKAKKLIWGTQFATAWRLGAFLPRRNWIGNERSDFKVMPSARKTGAAAC
jgi:hypothetical protein